MPVLSASPYDNEILQLPSLLPHLEEDEEYRLSASQGSGALVFAPWKTFGKKNGPTIVIYTEDAD